MHGILSELQHNLTKIMLLFFWLGLLARPLRVKNLTLPESTATTIGMFLLMGIGWRGGGELAGLDNKALQEISWLMPIGFLTNLMIGFMAYPILRKFVRLTKGQASIVAGYYGSDSAGTFITCLSILQSMKIATAPYMPVMLTVMEIPGCIVALILVKMVGHRDNDEGTDTGQETKEEKEKKLLHHLLDVITEKEVYLLLGGLLVGYIGHNKTKPEDLKDVASIGLLLDAGFTGLLSMFLFQMGTEASARFEAALQAGWRFVVFAIACPISFASLGIGVMHTVSRFIIHRPFLLGSYVLFAVLCGAASYIAVPAIHRSAIGTKKVPLALPLAAALGVTFTFNVTLGIPLYVRIAQAVIRVFPVA